MPECGDVTELVQGVNTIAAQDRSCFGMPALWENILLQMRAQKDDPSAVIWFDHRRDLLELSDTPIRG